MASAPEELKRHGPTEGLSFPRSKAEQLFKHHLNKKISWYETIEEGLNNFLAFVDCENDTQRYVLKICGDAWDKIKTESEVTAMKVVSKHTTLPIPKIIAYSSDKNNEFGLEWIIMTRTEGKPLRTSQHVGDIWTKLSIEQKKMLINELVDYVKQLHSRIPSASLIGNYRSNDKIGFDNSRKGPWKNYREYFNDQLKDKIEILTNDNVFAPVRDDVLQSIKEFRTLNLPTFDELPNVFTHNDLGLQNLTVSDDLKIRGILDWEWSGSYPIVEEYFRSYKPIVYDEQMKTYLFDQLEKQQIPTPRTIPRFSLLRKLYDFLQAIVPWYLTSLANPEHPTVEKELFKNRDKVEQLVKEIRKELK
ncbi:hypothetical protein I4U23_012188 [Adineta vaga]|nr:hypothetical protein I4U23_012188 [Adineta vaga]